MSDLPGGRPVVDSAGWTEVIRELGRAIPTPRFEASPRRRRLLFLTTIGASDLFSIREGLLAHALRLRGAEVTVFLCDGYPVCEARTMDADPPDMCEWCHPKGSANLAAFGLDELRLSDLVSPATARRLWQRAMATPAESLFETSHRGVPLGAHAYASTLRYFRAGRFEPDNPAYVERARRDLAAAMTMAEAAFRACATRTPDKIVSNHPGYAAWGPWCGMANARGIPYDLCAGGWRRNTLICQHGGDRVLHCDDLWPRYRDVPLSPEEERALDAYLATRETNEADFNPYWTDVDRDLGELRRRLGVPQRAWRRSLCAFTNVSWDAADFHERSVFGSMFAWVREIVLRAERHPDTLFWIKSHPAERKFVESTPQHWRIADKTRSELGALPDNVRFIPPEDNVSNYALYRAIDFGLVNTSTVGLEMALEGVPVLMTGDRAHYCRPELVVVPDDRDGYLATLDRWIELGPDFTPDTARARRYAYTLWFRKSIPFEPLDVLQWDARAIRVDSLEDLRPGRLPGLDAVCDGILEDAPFEARSLSPRPAAGR